MKDGMSAGEGEREGDAENRYKSNGNGNIMRKWVREIENIN